MAEKVYRQTLESMADQAGPEMVDRLANEIKELIREREELLRTRLYGRMLVGC